VERKKRRREKGGKEESKGCIETAWTEAGVRALLRAVKVLSVKNDAATGRTTHGAEEKEGKSEGGVDCLEPNRGEYLLGLRTKKKD